MREFASAAATCAVGLVLFSGTATASLRGQQTSARLERFLRESIGLDAGQLAAIARGEAVVKVLDSESRRDVAVFGIITVNVPRNAYIALVGDFQNSLRTPTRRRFGIFGNPAAASDVEAVTISEQDVADMRDCKPGDCVAKLPATDMLRIHREVDWSAPDRQARMNSYARQRLLDYVTAYRARGDSAMVVYDDRGTMNVRASDAFAALLAASPYVYQNVPSLVRYLSSYPRGTLTDAREVLFWSEDVLPRLRPILSVTHQVVYQPPEFPGMTLVVAKQLYANHYFEAAFDLTSVVDRPAPGSSYVLVLRRFRFDNLPEGILNIRGRAIGALRDQLLADVRRQKATAERAHER